MSKPRLIGLPGKPIKAEPPKWGQAKKRNGGKHGRS